MKKINLEEIAKRHIEDYNLLVDKQEIVNAMKEACKQALELAAENAEIVHRTDYIDNDSIINTINQIE